MTQVRLRYSLLRPLAADELEAFARIHAVYGILRVRPTASMDAIDVDYDASRLSVRDVESALVRSGFPLERRLQAQPA